MLLTFPPSLEPDSEPPMTGAPHCTAQAMPLLGHMHPPFFKIMDEIQEGLRYVFQTRSKYTCLISGTGHAGTGP